MAYQEFADADGRKTSLRSPVGPPDNESPISPALVFSWRRCEQRGLSRALASSLPPPAASANDEPTIAQTLSLVRPVLEDIDQFVEGSQTVIGFADAEARLLDLVGDQSLLLELAHIGWSIGSCWSEDTPAPTRWRWRSSNPSRFRCLATPTIAASCNPTAPRRHWLARLFSGR